MASLLSSGLGLPLLLNAVTNVGRLNHAYAPCGCARCLLREDLLLSCQVRQLL